MVNNVFIRRMSGEVFQEINYIDTNDLNKKLKLLITYNDSDLYIQLLINENILNNFDIIDTLILSKLNNNDFITIIFSQKKEMYCLNNENGKYILDYSIKNNYSKLLKQIIAHHGNKSYDIIKNSSYKDLILEGVKLNGNILRFISTSLQDDKIIVSEAIKQNGHSLRFASINLKNNKEIVLIAIKQNGMSLEYASIDLKKDKEIVLTAVKQNGRALYYTNFKNDKEIVLEAVKQNGIALYYASIALKNDNDIVLTAMKQNKRALVYASINLQKIIKNQIFID